MHNVEHVLTVQNELNECPLWDSSGQVPDYNEVDFFSPGNSLLCIDSGDPDHRLAPSFATSNGLGLSSVGKILYFVYTSHHNNLVYKHDPVPAGARKSPDICLYAGISSLSRWYSHRQGFK